MLPRPSNSEVGVVPLVAVVLSYLLGSIPVGVVICRPLGKDPRQVGSGRTGGTNVYRTAGLLPALLTIIGDIAKGWLAVALATWLVPGDAQVLTVALAALAAILGHNRSLFLGFRGGAGATPNVGAVLAIDPVVGLAALAVGAVGLLGVRIAAVATLAASATILIGLCWRVVTANGPYASPAILVYAVGQAALIVWTLRPNIARLRAGTERRITFGRAARAGGDEGESAG
jgi:acyl phosphate:glycerol-3-phosphate acyltransferase